MTEGKLMNRWWVVVGAILIQLCLGAIYAWNVFTNALTQAPYDFTQTQTQIIFAVGLATFAVVMILAGRLQAKFPPRLIALAGGLVLGIGYVAAGFVGTSFAGHVITIGLLGGAGIGLAYVIPIAVGVRWFPDKKGMLTGLAVAGFGFGALLWIKLAGSPGYLIANFGVANVFIIYGIAFAVLVSAGDGQSAGRLPARRLAASGRRHTSRDQRSRYVTPRNVGHPPILHAVDDVHRRGHGRIDGDWDYQAIRYGCPNTAVRR